MAEAIGGLASGIDTQGLIEKLMSLEQLPLNKIQTDKKTLDTKSKAFQAINTRISALSSAAYDLTLKLNLKAKKATSTDDSIFTATAGADAPAGAYKVKVHQLATSSTLTSAGRIGRAITSTQANIELSKSNLNGTYKEGTFTVKYVENGTSMTKTLNLGAGLSFDGVSNELVNQTGGALRLDVDAVTNQAHIVANDPTAVTSISAGGVGDTSNFASLTNLTGATYNAVTGQLSSTRGIGITQVNVDIDTTDAPGPSLAIGSSIDSTAGLATDPTNEVPAGYGQFQVNGVKIQYNTAEDSIADVLARINSSEAGVTATYNAIDDKITMTARETGAAIISLSESAFDDYGNATGNRGNFLTAIGLTGASAVMTSGQDAKVTISGVNGATGNEVDDSRAVSSSTNTFKDIIPGLNFTAKKLDLSVGNDPDQAPFQTITVESDKDAVVAKVQAFVDQYNQTIDAINSATAKGEANAYDSDLRAIKDRLMSMVTSRVSKLSGSPNTLVDIGISTSSSDKIHLSLNKDKFTAALNANADRISDLFSYTEDDPAHAGEKIKYGIAAKIDDYLDDVGSTQGVFSTRKKSVDSQQRNYDQQILRLSTRMAQKREALVKQFAAMEKTVSQLKSQQSAFLSQLSSL